MAHGYPDWSPLATGQDSELPSYRYSSGSLNLLGPSDQWLFSAFNPTGSGIVAKLRQLPIGLSIFATADGQDNPSFELWRTTSLGTGTPATATKHKTSDANSALTLRTALTVSPAQAAELAFFQSRIERLRELQPGRAFSPSAEYSLYSHLPAGQVEPITLRPGEGMFLVFSGVPLNVLLNFTPEWTEEPGT